MFVNVEFGLVSWRGELQLSSLATLLHCNYHPLLHSTHPSQVPDGSRRQKSNYQKRSCQIGHRKEGQYHLKHLLYLSVCSLLILSNLQGGVSDMILRWFIELKTGARHFWHGWAKVFWEAFLEHVKTKCLRWLPSMQCECLSDKIGHETAAFPGCPLACAYIE